MREFSRWAGASLLLLLHLGQISAPAGAEPVRVRVLTYNIHHGEGTDGKVDLDRIAKVIREARPDVVALQECDRRTVRSGRIDQPAELARLTGMQAVFGKNLDHGGGEYGNAVLSRWKIVEHQNHLLPRVGDREQRGVLDVTIEVPGREGAIRVLATHLDYGRQDVERLACCEALASLARARMQFPTLLAGDLNDDPGSRVVEVLKRTWSVPDGEPTPTIPASNPRRQIDYVLFRPAACWKLLEQRTLTAPIASDHLPLLAVLELLEKDPGVAD